MGRKVRIGEFQFDGLGYVYLHLDNITKTLRPSIITAQHPHYHFLTSLLKRHPIQHIRDNVETGIISFEIKDRLPLFYFQLPGKPKELISLNRAIQKK
jgi:hypothetical protein